MNTVQFFTDTNCRETCDPMDIRHSPCGAAVFELQMFLVDIGNGQSTWCGRLQNISGGDKRYFKGWTGLVANLQGLLTPIAQLEVLKALAPLDEIVY